MKFILALTCSCLFLAAACSPPPEPFTVTMAPAFGAVPRVLAVHPLLTSVPRLPQQRRVVVSTARQAGDLAIVPPVQTDLKVTLESEMMTQSLEADLAYRGFTIKALPVDVFSAGTGEGSTAGPAFGVSLATLEELRSRYGVEALVVGNVYLEQDGYASQQMRVRAAFVKVIDLASLDVLCHVAFTPENGTAEPAWVTAQLADQLDAPERPARQ